MRPDLTPFITRHGTTNTYWIAYSGGMDSHVLLHLMDAPSFNLRAIHINHGLSPNASAWEAHCQAICDALQIDLTIHRLTLKPEKGESLEEAARKARYAVFAELLKENDMLLTAHHQDDQAETFLLQLMRGAGLKGLSAMPEIKPFGKGSHGRPLLEFSREILLAYAKQKQLKWIEDESNQNEDFSRNYLRNQIMPLLKTHWPAAAETISRSAGHCAEAQVLLEEFALSDLDKIKGTQANTLSVSALLALPETKQRHFLRSWIQGRGKLLPDAKRLNIIIDEVLGAAPDRFPCVKWEGAEIRRFRDDVYLLDPEVKVGWVPRSSRGMTALNARMAALDEPSSRGLTAGPSKALDWDEDFKGELRWDLNQPCTIPGLGILEAEIVRGRGLKLDHAEVTVCFRQLGERINLPGRGRRTLKNLFQEWAVPAWERDKIPLLYSDEKLLSVVGYAVDADCMAKEDETGWEISLNRLAAVL